MRILVCVCVCYIRTPRFLTDENYTRAHTYHLRRLYDITLVTCVRVITHCSAVVGTTDTVSGCGPKLDRKGTANERELRIRTRNITISTSCRFSHRASFVNNYTQVYVIQVPIVVLARLS